MPRRFLRWLTANHYSPFDAIWIGLFALAIRDREHFAAFCFVLIGASLSGALQAIANRPTTRRTDA